MGVHVHPEAGRERDLVGEVILTPSHDGAGHHDDLSLDGWIDVLPFGEVSKSLWFVLRDVVAEIVWLINHESHDVFLLLICRRQAPGFLLRSNYTAQVPRVSATQQDVPSAHSPAFLQRSSPSSAPTNSHPSHHTFSPRLSQTQPKSPRLHLIQHRPHHSPATIRPRACSQCRPHT